MRYYEVKLLRIQRWTTNITCFPPRYILAILFTHMFVLYSFLTTNYKSFLAKPRLHLFLSALKFNRVSMNFLIAPSPHATSKEYFQYSGMCITSDSDRVCVWCLFKLLIFLLYIDNI